MNWPVPSPKSVPFGRGYQFRKGTTAGLTAIFPVGRTPCLASAVGTVALCVVPRPCRNPSYPPKKKVWSFFNGPPITPPNWFLLNDGGDDPRSKKFRASSALLRRYSNAVPCRTLVPDRVIADVTDPVEWPYSALNELVKILN